MPRKYRGNPLNANPTATDKVSSVVAGLGNLGIKPTAMQSAIIRSGEVLAGKSPQRRLPTALSRAIDLAKKARGGA